MESIIYHYTDRRERPIVTVCLRKKWGKFIRGLSICSKQEYPKRTKGIAKANGRADKAMLNKTSCLPIDRDEAIRLLFETGAPPFKYKAEYGAQLTEYERELVA